LQLFGTKGVFWTVKLTCEGDRQARHVVGPRRRRVGNTLSHERQRCRCVSAKSVIGNPFKNELKKDDPAGENAGPPSWRAGNQEEETGALHQSVLGRERVFER
jgi:hypothetical protein